MNPNGCRRPLPPTFGGPQGIFGRPDPYPKPPFTGPRPCFYY